MFWSSANIISVRKMTNVCEFWLILHLICQCRCFKNLMFSFWNSNSSIGSYFIKYIWASLFFSCGQNQRGAWEGRAVMHFGYPNIMILSVRTNLTGHSILSWEAIACHMESTQKTVFQFWAHLKFQSQLSKWRSFLAKRSIRNQHVSHQSAAWRQSEILK